MSDVFLLSTFCVVLSFLNISLCCVNLITNCKLKRLADRVLDQVDSGREVHKRLMDTVKMIRDNQWPNF